MAARAQGKGYSSATLEQEIALLQSPLKPPPALAIDIGGNVGDYTAELRKRNAALEIHVFEPSRTNIDKLNARFKDDPLILVCPYALSENSGSATLYADHLGSGMGSLTQRRLKHFNIAFEAAETVETLRFEDYWKSHLHGRNIDLVKIDVEGHELTVLKGFGSAITVTKVVQFEFGGTDIDTRTYFQDFWYYFNEARFSLFRMTPYGLQKLTNYAESDECFVFTNFVAVNDRQ
ncbi:MAG: FkbM family methyltransferase [Ferrovibrio sp.]